MTPREAGIQAFYADESTSNTLQGLNAAFDAYEAAAKPEAATLQWCVNELDALIAKRISDRRRKSRTNADDMIAASALYLVSRFAALSRAKEA